MVSVEELRATVERMEVRLAALADPSLIEARRLYGELQAQFEDDLGDSPRDVVLAKSAALMVLQGLAKARERASALINIDVDQRARALACLGEPLQHHERGRLGEHDVPRRVAEIVFELGLKLAVEAPSLDQRWIGERREPHLHALDGGAQFLHGNHAANSRAGAPSPAGNRASPRTPASAPFPRED